MGKGYGKRGFGQAFGDAAVGAAAAAAMRAVKSTRDYVRRRYQSKKSKAGGSKGYLKTQNFKKRLARYDKYDRYGYKHQQETSGLVSSLHCAYIGNNAINPVRYYEVLMGALLRFIMKRNFGVEYAQTTDYILPNRNTGGFFYTGDPISITVGLNILNTASGAVTKTDLFIYFSDVALGTLRTFDTVVSEMAKQFNAVDGGNRSNYLYEDVIIRTATQTCTFAAPTGETKIYYNAKNIYLKVYGIQHLTLQNATLSEGASSSTDVVDANPIVGKHFYYKGSGGPVLNSRYYNNTLTSDWSGFYNPMNEGVWFPSTDPPVVFQNAPGPENFGRVTSYKTMYLQPGQSSKYAIKKSLRGNLNYLLNALRHDVSSTANENWSYWAVPDRNIGQFFCFEKALKADRRVRLYYHLDMFHGAMVTSVSKLSLRASYDTATVNAPTNPALLVGEPALERSFAVAVSDADVRILTDNRSTDEDNQTTDCTAVALPRVLKRSRRRVHIAEDAQEEPTS